MFNFYKYKFSQKSYYRIAYQLNNNRLKVDFYGKYRFQTENKHFINSLTEVNRNWSVTKEHILANEPKLLSQPMLFDKINPEELPLQYHKKLSKSYSNPRTILKLYREYALISDKIDYPWLVRAFGQLGNTFGFNSYWSTKDKQVVHESLTFKQLVYDIIDRKHMIKPKNVPRILYSMACLEYRISDTFPVLLDHILENIKLWKSPTLANMITSLAILGIGDIYGDNTFGSFNEETTDYSNIVLSMIRELYQRSQDDPQVEDLTPFCWSSVSYSMVLLGLYEQDPDILPYFLNKASSKLSINNISSSGWVQFYLYKILYCADIEKPTNETEIKKAIPLKIQESLYDRWLPEIVLKGQNQGSEKLQYEVDQILNDIKQDSIMNCSIGRPYDKQHAFFCGHLIKSRNLALEYDYLSPIGPGRPKLSGMLQLKKRILDKLGLHFAIIHKTFWSLLEPDQKLEEILRILSQFGEIPQPKSENLNLPNDEESLQKYLKHKKKKINIWPPEKVIV